MKSVVVPACLVAILLSACAGGYENRIAGRLSDAGLSRPMASCMAERMVHRLSTPQLKRLANFGRNLDRDIDSMTIAEITRRFSAIGDPEIVEVVTRAGLGCAISVS